MADAELEAMEAVHGALDPLDEQSRARVLSWVAAKFGIEPPDGTRPSDAADGAGTNLGGGPSSDDPEFKDIVDVFNAAQVSTGPQHAVIAAYWFQIIQDRSTWTGSDINIALRNLGSGLSNVTRTLDSLKDRKPALVMQVSKSGRSKQARKTYKLTTAGIRAAEQMLSARTEGEAS